MTTDWANECSPSLNKNNFIHDIDKCIFFSLNHDTSFYAKYDTLLTKEFRQIVLIRK